jgi:peptidoglycan/LPS O-acetylase OafA/YrhL
MTHIQRKHFEVLDGLRGIAAFAVVIFHFMEYIAPDYSQSFIGHGFLAVDFFFCLSGFVIAYAYDGRMTRLGLMEFFRSRLIRLHPLIVFGSVLGLLGFFIESFIGPPHLVGGFKIAVIFFCSILLIPFPVMASRFFNNFGLNAPAWSLFWEYVANLFYALFLHRIRRNYLMVFMLFASAGIVWVIYKRGSLLGGWNGDTFWDGLIRVSYSFLAGMFIYRSKWIVNNRLGFLSLAVLLMMGFMVPFTAWNLLWESLIVLIYFPLLIGLGAGTMPVTRVRKFCNFSANISYPLYMTHYWLIWIFGNYFTIHHPVGMRLFLIVLGILTLQIVLAYVVMRVFDTPVRRALSKRTRAVND